MLDGSLNLINIWPDVQGSKEEILEYVNRAKEQILSCGQHLTGYQKKFIKLLTYTQKKVEQSNGVGAASKLILVSYRNRDQQTDKHVVKLFSARSLTENWDNRKE